MDPVESEVLHLSFKCDDLSERRIKRFRHSLIIKYLQHLAHGIDFGAVRNGEIYQSRIDEAPGLGEGCGVHSSNQSKCELFALKKREVRNELRQLADPE